MKFVDHDIDGAGRCGSCISGRSGVTTAWGFGEDGASRFTSLLARFSVGYHEDRASLDSAKVEEPQTKMASFMKLLDNLCCCGKARYGGCLERRSQYQRGQQTCWKLLRHIDDVLARCSFDRTVAIAAENNPGPKKGDVGFSGPVQATWLMPRPFAITAFPQEEIGWWKRRRGEACATLAPTA